MTSTNEVTTTDVSQPDGFNEEQGGTNEDAMKIMQFAETVDNSIAGGCNPDAATTDIAISATKRSIGAENANHAASLTKFVGSAVATTLPPFPGNAFVPYPPIVISSGEMQWEQLVAGSSLVFLTDRNLVPDSLFLSMAQMEPCLLGELDRCGAYKNREIG